MTERFRIHEDAAMKDRRVRRRRPEPPKITRVPPEAMIIAHRLADGDPSRIRVIDATTVLVANRGRHGLA